jgi:hypothetical protein
MNRFDSVVTDETDESHILGAYEILGDESSSAEARRRATLALAASSTHGSSRAPTRPALGGLTERPRAALPAPPLVLHAGCSGSICFQPQVPMRGPYWLGLTEAASLRVLSVTFGNQCAFRAMGEVPGEFFDVSRGVDKLIAIAGETLSPGMLVRVELRNVTACTLETSACLWGNDIRSLEMMEPGESVAGGADSLALRARVAELESLVKRWERSTADLLAKLDRERPAEAELPEVAAERARRAEHDQRARADRDASWAHHADPGFEPGDVWETPSDES